jgi:hypothetical protein
MEEPAISLEMTRIRSIGNFTESAAKMLMHAKSVCGLYMRGKEGSSKILSFSPYFTDVFQDLLTCRVSCSQPMIELHHCNA